MAKHGNFKLIVNGVEFPAPQRGFQIIRSQNVDAGRNTKGEVVGQLVGRKLYKLNNLKWAGLTAEQWKAMQDALEPFFVNVTFVDDSNIEHTLLMYPSDTTGQPYWLANVGYEQYESCSFNLIDCGK